MLNLKKTTTLLLFNILGVVAAFSIPKTFEVNGIFYCPESDDATTVTVEKPSGNSRYEGLVNIPATVSKNGVTYTVVGIEHEAFRAQDITGVVFPKTLKKIGYYAFRGCGNLKNVVFSSDGELEMIENYAFAACNSITNLNFPASLKVIDHHAFEDCTALKAIKWGGVEVLEKAAFKGCDSLDELDLSDNVTYIGEMCFWGCEVMSKAHLGSSVEYIGPDAFLDCHQLEEVNIPSTVKEIGYEAFRGCWYLTKIDIPDSVKEMGYGAFRYCTNLTQVTLGNSLREIPLRCFEQTPVENIVIPNSVEVIGGEAFSGCTELLDVTFGNGLKRIDDYAFLGCTRLAEVIFKEPLEEIGQGAFNGCSNLSFASIPASTRKLHKECFANCPSLTDVYYYATVPPNLYPLSVFAGSAPEGCKVNVHVLEGLGELFSTALGWYDIGDEYTANINVIDDIPVVAIEKIEFVESPIYCGLGEQKKAELRLLPENSFGELSWEAEDESILYVDMLTGEFIGLAEGETLLKVWVSDRPEIKAECKVIVTNAAVGMTPDDEWNDVIYDIYGRRLENLQKGINIVNGKKILVK